MNQKPSDHRLIEHQKWSLQFDTTLNLLREHLQPVNTELKGGRVGQMLPDPLTDTPPAQPSLEVPSRTATLDLRFVRHQHLPPNEALLPGPAGGARWPLHFD